MARTNTAPRSDNINIRVSAETLRLIDMASRIYDKTRSEFILDTMRQAAEEILIDQRLLVLKPEQWQEFTALLDASPQQNQKLQALLARKPAWEDD